MMVPVWILSVGFGVIGIYLLIQGIKRIMKAAGGSVLLKLPLTQKSGQFVVTNAGDYTIWQSGRTLQRVPMKMSAPTIQALLTGEKVTVNPTFSSIRVNNGWEGRIQLFTFRAEAGEYKLELATPYPESAYALEIRERKPGYLLVFGILIVLLGAACLIGAMVLPVI
ncbi:BRCT domain-containing protein [Spirosoma litoris]